MRIMETKVYPFEELNEAAKKTAIDNLYDLNVDHQWWDCTYDEAKNLGFEIRGFDVGQGSSCEILIVENHLSCIMTNILDSHGETCDTYTMAKEYQQHRNQLVRNCSDGIHTDRVSEEHEDKFDDLEDELNDMYKERLSEEYLSLLRKEYEYLTSDEAIKETIESNEYEFTAEGKLI